MNDLAYDGKTRYQTEAVADVYDRRRFSSLKGRLTDHREKICVLRALERADVSGPVLDIPCGTGRMTELLLERGLHVTAADISEAMIDHAKAKTEKFGSQVTFVRSDIETMGFPDESFELILTIRLLHHIPQTLHSNVFQQLHRATRRWLIISFSNRYTLQNVRRDIESLFTKFPRYSISPALFKEEIDRAGFRIVDYIPLVPLFSESVIVLLEKR